MRQLIVNADDFGLTEQVSRGILDAHREGIVTSTTLMANGKAFEWAVSLGRGLCQLSIGVHLNLSEGLPVAPAINIPSLVDLEGRLHLSPGRLLLGIATRQVNIADVETEFRQQITKVIEAGIMPTHLDGHQHVHVLPGIADLVIRLAREFKIPSIRCPQEDPPRRSALRRGTNSRVAVVKQYFVGRAVSYFAQRFRQKLADAGLLCPAHFYGLSQTGFLDATSIEAILDYLPKGVSELMCHPGYVDADLVKSGTRLLAQREAEIRALTAHEVRRLLSDRGIHLISYRQLAARALVHTLPFKKCHSGSRGSGTNHLQKGVLNHEQ